MISDYNHKLTVNKRRPSEQQMPRITPVYWAVFIVSTLLTIVACSTTLRYLFRDNPIALPGPTSVVPIDYQYAPSLRNSTIMTYYNPTCEDYVTLIANEFNNIIR